MRICITSLIGSYRTSLFDVHVHCICYASVTGEANFTMERTALTLGGFTQPAVARSIITMQGSAEKGLAQRFMWIFPKPVFEGFSSLEPVDKQFTEKMGICYTTNKPLPQPSILSYAYKPQCLRCHPFGCVQTCQTSRWFTVS